MLKQKGSHQRDLQEVVNQGEASHQEAQEGLSSHARELEEKARIAELMAEAEYIEQRQLAENQAEMLKFNRSLLRATQEQKFMASMTQNLLTIEVSYQMTK